MPTPQSTLDRPGKHRSRLLLLIADADEQAARSVAAELARHQIDAQLCLTAGDALFAAGGRRPDAALVATNLTDIPSTDLVRLLHTRAGLRVLLGIAHDDATDVASALAAGAAAAITRPYRPAELVAILRALAPATTAPPHRTIRHGGLHLDPASHEVRLHGRPVELPLREFQLLQYLMATAGRVATHDRIHRAVWGNPAEQTSNTLAVHVRRLRARLGDNHRQPRIIVTVRGVGYRFVAPDGP